MKTSLNPTYLKALWLYQQKKWQAAANELQKVRQQDPNNAKALFKLGMCHYRLKQWIRAADRMTEALALAPQNQHWTVQQQKAVKESVKSKLTTLKANTKLSATQKEDRVRNLLALDYNNAELHNELAHALRKQGKWWQEVEALTQATSLKPQFPTWHYRLGEALEAMNRFQQAAAAYGTAIELKKGKAEALWHYRQGFCYEREGHDGAPNPAAAQKAYQQATAKDATLNAKRYGIGVFHQSRGYWPQALAAYSQQWQKQPWDAELCYRTGMAHDRCYDWRQAEDWYKKALSILLDKPQWHYRLGFVLERQEKYLEAAQAYEYAATHAEKHTPYWFYRWGYVLDKAGQHEQAVQAFLRTKEQPTLDAPVEAPVDAPIYLQQVTSHQFIADTLEEVLRHDTTNPEHWYQLGNAYERLENWEKAADAYEHAVKRSNNHRPLWYYRLGYVLAQINNFKIACEQLRHTRILQKAYGVSEDKFNNDAGFRQAATYTEYYEGLEIQPKTVLYESFHGASMSCNPYALFLHLIESDEFKNWTHIWIVNDLAVFQAKFKNNSNIIFVKRDSDAYMRHLASAAYLINNNTFPPYFIKKDLQCYLNTWHGTPLKKLGKDNSIGFCEHKNASRNFLHADYILSPNSHTTNVLIERHDVDEILSAKILEIGYPRIDLSLNSSLQQKQDLIKLLNLDPKRLTILYAPTYRGSSISATGNVDDEAVVGLLNKLAAFNKYNILLKAHHLIEQRLKKLAIKEVVFVENHLDTNELLSIVDLLVTDYSSIMFDFIPLNKPMVLFTYDQKDYINNRGLYFDLGELGMPYASGLDDCVSLIESVEFNKKTNYKVELRNKFSMHEDGSVSEKVAQIVFNKSEKFAAKPLGSKKKKMLLYAGALMLNGITVSLRNLLNVFNFNENSVSVSIDPVSIQNFPDRLEQFELLPTDVNVLPRVGRMNLTIEEAWINDKVMRQHNLHSTMLEQVLSYSYQREYKRLYGSTKFDVIINFEGYVRYWVLLFACAKNHCTRNTIYLHNDMAGEWRERFPSQESVFEMYKNYDALVSVSKSTNAENKNKIRDAYNIDNGKFVHVDNLLNHADILERADEEINNSLESSIIESASPLFINISRLSVEKGQINLIQAFKEVLASNPSAKLIIVGDGPLKVMLLNQIKKEDLMKSVFLFGRKSNPYPYLKKADCFVFSSKHEGQGLVLLEAMVLQKPIICTDFPCAHDVLQGGEYGLIVENTVQGLVNGFKDYISGAIKVKCFDVDGYQNKALDMFNVNVIGLE